MGITASTSKQLNYYKEEDKDNSGISTTYITATGNKQTSVANNILNDTYTLDTSRSEAEINARLLNFDDAVFQSGGSVGAKGYKQVMVFGHPDKFIFDYAQDYNNCGVDSCLNILAMAGIKDVVEVTPEYEKYLGTPITKTTKKAVYNEETGIWETKEVTETTYPKRPVETEDSFLLWAVQNSKNDEEFYLNQYDENYDSMVYQKYLDSYVIHSKNAETYKNISDLQNNPTEVGGTYIWMQSNILNYYGVSHTVETPDVVILAGKNKEKYDSGEVEISLTDTGKTDDKGNAIYTRTTRQEVITYSDHNKTVTTMVKTKTVDVVIDGDSGYKNAPNAKELTSTVTTTETTLNRNFYYFAEDFYNAILEGKGIILGGYANALLTKGGQGGYHAITVVGVVTNDERNLDDQTIVKKVTESGSNITSTEWSEKAVDILGFYVIDTGGFLNPSKSSNAQFVSCDTLYEYITNSSYTNTNSSETLSGASTATGDYIVTTENIRKWADNLNLTGNNRKNVLTGNDANNIIHGGDGNDVLYGGGGNDTLYGDNDKDTLYGGAGDDLLIGGKGDDLYVFQKDDGPSHDTIVAGQGRDDIQFDHVVSEDLSFLNNNGSLVIQYGEDSTLTLQNYFKKNLYSSIYRLIEYIKVGEDEPTLNSYDFVNEILSGAKIQYNPVKNKTNKITGTKFVDEITGGDLNDTISAGDGNDILNGGAGNDVIKGGNGNDTIIAGLGNDNITGGAGHNEIRYAKGDGNDVINLTKGENCDIKLTGFSSESELTYKINKKDLVISYTGDDNKTYTLTLKNFGTKDVTNNATKKSENTSSVNLYLNDTLLYDLREGNYLPEYTAFTTKNYKYTGNWHSETIDATALNETFPSKNRGANINAGAGNDIIYGSKYNDTIKGGDGDDIIINGYGTDKVDGGNGNDTYKVFYYKNETARLENVTISDTGKNSGDVDVVEFNCSTDELQIWFNMDKNGKTDYKFNVSELVYNEGESEYRKTGSTATISGVEKLVASTSDDLIYDYGSDALKEEIISFLGSTTHNYKDVNDVMKNGTQKEIEDLLAIFNNSDNWVQNV